MYSSQYSNTWLTDKGSYIDLSNNIYYTNVNRQKATYFNNFVDISGGDLVIRGSGKIYNDYLAGLFTNINNNFNTYSQSISGLTNSITYVSSNLNNYLTLSSYYYNSNQANQTISGLTNSITNINNTLFTYQTISGITYSYNNLNNYLTISSYTYYNNQTNQTISGLIYSIANINNTLFTYQTISGITYTSSNLNNYLTISSYTYNIQNYTTKSTTRALLLLTTGQTYAPDIGYGDTTTFQASNLCCNLLYTNNANPMVGVDIGTQIGNINTLIYNLQSKLFDLTHTGTTTTITNSLVFTGTLNTITPTTFSYLTDLSGNLQNQLNNITKNYVLNSTVSSIYQTISGFNTAIANYVTNSSLTSTLNNYTNASNLASFAFSGNPTITSPELAYTDTSTKIPTAKWVSDVINIATNNMNSIITSTYTTTANLASFAFTGNPTITSTELLSTDVSNKIPTAKWVSDYYHSISAFNNSIANYTTTANLNTLLGQKQPNITSSSTISCNAVTLPSGDVQTQMNNITSSFTNYTPTANLTSFAFSGNPTITSTQLLSTEASTKIPTTKWVSDNYHSISAFNTAISQIQPNINSSTNITCNDISLNGTLNISRKVNGFQQKIWNSNDLGMNTNPYYYSSYNVLFKVAYFPALYVNGQPLSSTNDSQVSVKGWVSFGYASTNKINFDFQIGTGGTVSLNGFCWYNTVTMPSIKLDFELGLQDQTLAGYYLFFKIYPNNGVNDPINFEFVVGGNSSSVIIYEPSNVPSGYPNYYWITQTYFSVLSSLKTRNTTNQYFYGGTMNIGNDLNCNNLSCTGITCSSLNFNGTFTVGGTSYPSTLLVSNSSSSNTTNPTFSQSVTVGTNCFIKATTVNSLDINSSFPPYSDSWLSGSSGYYPTTANTSWLGIMQTDALYVNRPYIARDMIMKNTGASNNILFYGPDTDYATYGYIRSFGRISMNSSFDIVANANTPNGVNIQAYGSSSAIKLDSSTVNITANTINLTGSSPSISSTNNLTITSYNMTFTNTLNNINTTIFSYLSGVTGNIQTQFNNLSAIVNGYVTNSSLATTLNSYLLTSTFNNTLANYTTLNVLSSTLNSYHTISAFNSSIAGYQPSITTSTNLSINNLNVGGYATLPCILRSNTTVNTLSIASNSATTITWPTANTTIGNTGLLYNANGTFTNVSGTTLSFNVSATIAFSAGGTANTYRAVFVQHSTYNRIGQTNVTHPSTTTNCVVSCSANVILTSTENFQIMGLQNSGTTLYLSGAGGFLSFVSIR